MSLKPDEEYTRVRYMRVVQRERTLVVRRSLETHDKIKAAFPNEAHEILEELPDWYVEPSSPPAGWVQHHPYVGDGPIPLANVQMVDLVEENMYPIEEPDAQAG